MANIQYIGARYVPKFYLNPDDQSNDWKSGVLYEALTIVNYNNDSYTSKKVVPNNIGNPHDNPEYWACTTKYTAALQALQTTVGDHENRLDKLESGYLTFNDLFNDSDVIAGIIVKTQGFYEPNDGGGAYYIITSSPTNPNLVLYNGLFAELIISEDRINVLTLGAHKDNSADNSALINSLFVYGLDLYFPDGEYQFLAALDIAVTSMIGHRIYGEDKLKTIFRFNVFPSINVATPELTISKVTFAPLVSDWDHVPPIITNYYETAFIKCGKYDSGFSDYSITVDNCHFTYNNCALWAISRNIKFVDNLISALGTDHDNAVVFWDFPTTELPGEDDPNVNAADNANSGKRCAIIENNRTHFTRAYLLANDGYNSVNSRGLHLVNNYVEGSLLARGYLRDAIITNNHSFLLDSVYPWIDCIDAKNVVISNNMLAGIEPYTSAGGVSVNGAYPSAFFNCSGDLDNVTMANNVISNNHRDSTYIFSGNVRSLKISDIINDCAKDHPVLNFNGTGKTISAVKCDLVISEGDIAGSTNFTIYAGDASNTYDDFYGTVATDTVFGTLSQSALKNKARVMQATSVVTGVGTEISLIPANPAWKTAYVQVFNSSYTTVYVIPIPYVSLSGTAKEYVAGGKNGDYVVVEASTVKVTYKEQVQNGSQITGGAMIVFFD